MIEIVQQKLPKNTLCGNFNKIDEVELHMSKDMITKDINRIKSLKPINKYDKENIKALKNYFNSILKNINDESIFELCWNTDKDLPYSYPINLINEDIYNINICNYIELNTDQNLLEINIKHLADIIAFEIMIRDLGETHESIEELLKDCGILGYQSSKLLTDFFELNGDDVFNLSKSMKIDDTPYYSFETKKVHDYFSSKEFNKKNYREVVEHSCKYAATIIANTLLKNAFTHSIDMKPIILSSTTLAFIINNSDNETIRKKILDEISVRAFGRRFIIEPDIQIL